MLRQQENIGKVIELIGGFLAISTSLGYVVLDYIELIPGKLHALFDILDFVACCVFMCIYLFKVYIATHRIQYVFSLMSMLDLAIMLPILIYFKPDETSTFYFLIPFSRFLRSMTFVIILSRYYKLGQTDVDRQINIVFMTMVLLAYISSGMYGIVENINRKNGTSDYLQFHDSAYFVVVSLATVGYGDEVPHTEFGRVVVLFIILFTLVLIPAQTNELLRLMQIRSRYRRIEYKSLDVRHIVITGSVDLESLSNYCNELFHPDHGSQAINAAIIQDHDPHSEMEIYFQNNKLSLTYIAGDCFEDDDLERSMLNRAESCVVLTNKNCTNSLEEDYKNILTALSLKKFVYNMNKHLKDASKYNIKLCIQLIKPESKTLYFKSLNLDPTHDQLIMVEEIKMNLLAKSCFAPGLISCMSNLFASGARSNETFTKEWMKEYASGMSHEIYRVLIQENEFTSQPHPITFKKIAEICYTEYSALIFALEIELKGQTKSIVRLNPSQFQFIDWINYNYYLYVICEDESVATMVQKLEMNDDKFEKYMGRIRQDKINRLLHGTTIILTGKDQMMGTNGPLLSKSFESKNGGGSAEENDSEEEKKMVDIKTKLRDQASLKKNHSINDDGEPKMNKLTSKKSMGSKNDPKSSKKKDALIEKNQGYQLEKDYDILKKPKSQTEVLIKGGNIKLTNHIVVCGLHSSMYHFILPLRAKYLKNYQQDIVIISSVIKQEVWESISKFPRVFLVEGSPLSSEVLRQAYIHKADKAVIMGYDPSSVNENSAELNDEMVDARSIFIYKAIKKLNPTLQILTEIYYQSNIDFLLPKGKTHDGFNFSTLYAAGEVYIASTIDTLTAQAFYNPHIVTIVQQILVGQGDQKQAKEAHEQEILNRFDGQLKQSNLWQVLVPEEFVNQTYEKLFKHLLEKDLVPIGLYRLTGATDNRYPYCYTNPDPKTSITYKDRVFVLASEIPNDLIIDVKQSTRTYGNQRTVTTPSDIKLQSKAGGSQPDFYGSKEISQQILVDQLGMSNHATSQLPSQTTQSFNRRKSVVLSKIQSHLAGRFADGLDARSRIQRADGGDKRGLIGGTQTANYDDASDQINSLEFMTKTIQELENKLGDIEANVAAVKKILAEQDLAIKQEVENIQTQLLQNADDENTDESSSQVLEQ